MGRLGYFTKRGNWEGRGSPCMSKSLNFPHLLDKNITYWEISHIGKKTLIAFRKFLTKTLPAACIQLPNYDLFEKAQLKLSSLIPCPAGSSPRIICQGSPILKVSQNCCTNQVRTVPHFPKPLWVTLGMGKNPTQQPKIYSFPRSEESSLID